MDLRLAMRQCFLLRRKEKTLLISFLLKEKTNGPLPPSQKNFLNFSFEGEQTDLRPATRRKRKSIFVFFQYQCSLDICGCFSAFVSIMCCSIRLAFI